MSAHDLVALGRIGVDLYPQQANCSLAEARTFEKSLGGSAANVTVAAARLGCRARLVTKVGDDPFGAYLIEQLAAYGVDASQVGVHPSLRTPLAFCEMHPPDHFPLLFYRAPTAPDLTLAVAEVDMGAVVAARVLWTTGTGLSAEPSRTTTLLALEERARQRRGDPSAIAIHDLDHRPGFWDDEREAGRWARAALRHATVAVGNVDEVSVAVGEREPRAAAAALLDLGVQLAIVKRGPDGVYARTAEQELDLAPVVLDVVNGLGAGDAFGGALCAGLAGGWGLEPTLRAANAAGALVASRPACAPDMPTREELRALGIEVPASVGSLPSIHS